MKILKTFLDCKIYILNTGSELKKYISVLLKYHLSSILNIKPYLIVYLSINQSKILNTNNNFSFLKQSLKSNHKKKRKY